MSSGLHVPGLSLDSSFEDQQRRNSRVGRLSIGSSLKSINNLSKLNTKVNPSQKKSNVTVSSYGDIEREEKRKKTMRLEDQITNEKLTELERIFEAADEDGGGGLDMEEFRNAMRKAMGDHLTDHELDTMFMKVDTNCDGTVDWDEYLSYMLLEYQEKDQMDIDSKTKPFPQQIRLIPEINDYQRYSDSIIKIGFFPNMTKGENNLYDVVYDTFGKYVTVTKEGSVNFWSVDLQHIKSFRVASTKGTNKRLGVWVTTLECLPNVNMLAISTTNCCITFYDLTAGYFTPVLILDELETSVTCMDYWLNSKKPNHAIFIWGDARGNISAMVFNGCPTVCFLQPTLNKNFKFRVKFTDILRSPPCGVLAYKLPRVHDDFVLNVKYYPDIDCFLSCCRTHKTSLYMGDLDKKKASYYKVNRGVFDFDYCKEINVIVTGGQDMLVRVWNPYVPSKPVLLLQGHNSPIRHIIVNERQEFVISISEDNQISVFDLHTQIYIQSIFRKFVLIGPRSVSAACYNPYRQALLIGTNHLAVFEHREEYKRTHQLTSHSKPVNVVLYNKLFNQVVSGGADSLVAVWDRATGEKMIQFYAHKVRVRGGEDKDVEITAMRFDPTLRRLITGARDGTVKVWNFNNGALLKELVAFDNKEITSIVCTDQRILTAGWNQRIALHVDSREDSSCFQWPRQHQDDIHTVAYIVPSTIVSGSYDGDIYIWSLETAHALGCLNADVDIKPQNIAYRKIKSLQRKRLQRISARPRDYLSKLRRDRILSGRKSPDRFRAVGTLVSVLRGGSPEGGDRTPRSPASDVPSDKKDTPKRENRNFHNQPCSVEKILILETRHTAEDCANLVATYDGGWVRSWSIHREGGLLGQFNAAHRPGGSVVTACTDHLNQYLVTGDSEGYIKVWDITEYCISHDSKDKAPPIAKDVLDCFPLTTDKPILRDRLNDQSKFPRPSVASQPSKTLKAPPILNSFRAHLQTVTCLDYVDEEHYVVSCSSDCSVRLWTVYGEYLGIFGQEVPWSHHLFSTRYKLPDEPVIKATEPVVQDQKPTTNLAVAKSKIAKKGKQILTAEEKEQFLTAKLPPDVRRVASATTLRVLKGKHPSLWRRARNILLVWVPKLASKKTKDIDIDELIHGDLVKTDIPSAVLSKDKVHWYSDVLGKSFKTDRKHHVLPQLPRFREFEHLVDVYSCLRFHELQPTETHLEPPQIILDIQERHRNMMARDAEILKRGHRGSRRRQTIRTNLSPLLKLRSPKRGSLWPTVDAIQAGSRQEHEQRKSILIGAGDNS